MRPEIEAVKERDGLKAYLETLEGDEGLLTARRVAFRAAARVLPVTINYTLSKHAAKRNVTALHVFSAVSFGSIANAWPTPPIHRDAAVGARACAYHAAQVADSGAAAFAADSSTAAAHAAAFSAQGAEFAARAARACARVAEDIANAWVWVRADLEKCAGDPSQVIGGIWQGLAEPEVLRKMWEDAKRQLEADATADRHWRFWILWYERVRAGRDFHADMLADILNPLREDDWKKGPAHINPLFDKLLAKYEEDAALEKGEPTSIADAAYFDFIEVNRQMRAVAFPSDHAAFPDDATRDAFMKAAHDLRLTLEDWCDLARAQLQGRNAPVTTVIAIEKMLDQLSDLERGEELSLRNLIRVGSNARRLARTADLESNLGDALFEILTESLDDYAQLVRVHLGDVLEALDVLRQLELGNLDSARVLASLKAAISRMERVHSDELLPMDARTRAIFADMIADLEDEQSEIAEGKTEGAQRMRAKRFAERFGGVSATFARYVELGSKYLNAGAARFDDMGKWFKRVQTIEKIVEWLDKLGS